MGANIFGQGAEGALTQSLLDRAMAEPPFYTAAKNEALGESADTGSLGSFGFKKHIFFFKSALASFDTVDLYSYGVTPGQEEYDRTNWIDEAWGGVLEMASDNAADTDQTVEFVTLDANNEIQYTQATQNGADGTIATAIPGTHNALLLARVIGGTTLAGNLQIQQTGGGDIKNIIEPGRHLAQQINFKVPAGYNLHVSNLEVKCYDSGNVTNVVPFAIDILEFNPTTGQQTRIGVFSSNDGRLKAAKTPFVIGPGLFFNSRLVNITGGGVNLAITASADMMLVPV